MGHNRRIDLLVRHRRSVPAGIKPPSIDLPGNLPHLHPVTGTDKKIDYGFGEGHWLLYFWLAIHAFSFALSSDAQFSVLINSIKQLLFMLDKSVPVSVDRCL